MRALRFVVAIAVALCCAACGGSSLNPCEKGAVHAFDCNAREAYTWNNNNACTDSDACVANCVSAAPCGALTGADANANAAYNTCIDACPGTEL